MQGERDLPVGEQDARTLEESSPGAVLRLVPNANHVLKAVNSADVGANVAAHSAVDLPLAPGVFELFVAFIRALPRQYIA